MEYDNKFCDSALGLGLCYMALNSAINPNYYNLNTNIQQNVNPCYSFQFDMMQNRIDNCNWRMLQLQREIQMQMQMPQYTNLLNVWSEPKKYIVSIYDLDRILFPDDPIRDWCEKRVKEIEEEYKWIDEVEWE